VGVQERRPQARAIYRLIPVVLAIDDDPCRLQIPE
jgi:hypothetical protein